MVHQVPLSDLSEEAENYLRQCARIRRISTTRLLQRVLKLVCDDQLVLGILDDDSKPSRQLAGEATKSHYYHFKEKVT